ncbi:protein FAM149B1-like isoform X3 [Crassostrea angulata]|uniref:protein FAM149B1 isoform X3 n=1 Tax=Magallana gigas TaxID=29159 RepID=UPI00148AD046|nr:protein FAM149B1 isoform X4 [Crassostrea gigas]XP_052685691.1 protein FAM149B1-like isoform X3 [Crassostrea angulata]
MGTDVMLRHVHMSHPNPKYWKLSLDVKSVSRGGVGHRTIKLPHRRSYGLSRSIVCVSAKIHKRRGIPQGSLHDPYPSIETQPPLPTDFLATVTEALTSYHGTPSSSGRSTPTITEAQIVHTVQVGEWGTGNTTERSSTGSTSTGYSWDEFDKQAAKTVQNLFDEIDSVLFEQSGGAPPYIHKECQEWGAQFPHLRILGNQLMSPNDQGFQLIEREGSRPMTGSLGLVDVTENEIAATQDIQGLSLSGKRVQARKPPVEARSNRQGSDAPFTEFTHLEEEIFEQEGDYEEIIAIEYKDVYDESSNDKKQLTPRRRRVGYPPITPNASIKDSVISSAFDAIWQEIVSWMQPLTRKYTMMVLDERKPIRVPILDQIRADHPLPSSREPSFSFLNNKIQRSNTTIGVTGPRLENVLHISTKKLQSREATSLTDSDPIINTARPASSANPSLKMSNRPISVKLTQQRSTRSGLIRLAPIDNRSKTPNVEDEKPGPSGALKVTRITPHSERLSSPPTHHQRNGTLPPLGSERDVVPSPSQGRAQKKVYSANRASSAVDKDIRSFRDRYTMSSDARPSTTHAMRSDTPLGGTSSRRASTPLVPQRNSQMIGPSILGITGSGLQPSSELSNFPPDIMEDAEVNQDYHNQWTPSPPSQHNPYRRYRSSLVRS